MDALKCFVLMPFSDDFTFVYELGIKPVLKELESRTSLRFPVERADERLSLRHDKAQEVTRKIKEADLAIIDVTGESPNVLWEMGVCHALEKHTVILSQSADNLPFYLRSMDVFVYNFSYRGMEQMRKSLALKLLSLLDDLQRDRRTLLFDRDFKRLNDGVQYGLSKIDQNSILRNLAMGEIKRLYGRIIGLQQGKFDLRNEKPNKEIIEYFCDYIRQLTGEESEYHTVSDYKFWMEITDQGGNFEFLNSNIQAARALATINRVFLVNAHEYPGETVKDNEIFRRILSTYWTDTQPYSSGLQEKSGVENTPLQRITTKIFFSKNYERDYNTYKNFGILRKATEYLLFKPNYLKDGRMEKTDFVYFDKQKPDTPGFKDNWEKIQIYYTNFNILWEKSEILSEKHFT